MASRRYRQVPRMRAHRGPPLARTRMHREKSLKNSRQVPMIDSALSSLTLRRYAADGAIGLVEAALTSVTALSISAQRLA